MRGLALLCGAVIAVDMVGGLTVGYPPMLVFLLHEAPFMGQDFDPGAWAEVALAWGFLMRTALTSRRPVRVERWFALLFGSIFAGSTTRASAVASGIG